MPKMPVVSVFPRPYEIHCPLCKAYQIVRSKLPASVACEGCAKRFRVVNGWTYSPEEPSDPEAISSHLPHA